MAVVSLYCALSKADLPDGLPASFYPVYVSRYTEDGSLILSTQKCAISDDSCCELQDILATTCAKDRLEMVYYGSKRKKVVVQVSRETACDSVL